MTGRGRTEGAGLPRVDEGEAPRPGAALVALLAPVPGQWGKTLRITGIILVVLAISETFRIPDPAVSAYMAIIFFAADENATQKLARVGGLVIAASLVVAVAQFMIDLSQPVLRLGMMALSTFLAGFLSRRLKLGMVTIVAGLFIVSVQRSGDDVLSGALSPGYVPNTTTGSVPELAFMSPEEALLHDVLWELVAFVFPIVIVFLVNRLVARPPSETLRAALVDRLETAAAFCRGEPDGERRLLAAARSGLPAVEAQNALAASFERGRYDPSLGRRLIDGITRLLVVLVAWRHLPQPDARTADLRPAGEACDGLALRLRTKGRDRAVREEALTLPATTASRRAGPLANQLDAALREVRGILDGDPETGTPAPKAAPRSGTADAGRDPGPARFALKLTLAVMSAYLFMALTDWSQIATCLTTCFVLATDSLGQSFHKLALRVAGALAGGAVGFLTILLVMPMLTDIGDLFLVLTPVLLAFGWIRTGSERISYFGQQGAFAFLLTVVQDYGPTLEFQAARNRIIGILVGEIVMFVVFTRLWPETVGDVVRKGLADALGALSDLLGRRAAGAEADAYRRFDAAIAKVRAVLPEDRYEAVVRRPGARGTIDADTLSRVQALVVPVSIIADLDRGSAGAEAERRRADAMAGWLGACATWMRTGRGGETLADTLPPAWSGGDRPGRAAGTRTFWLDILDRDIRGILDDVGPASASPDRPHAAPRGALGVAEP